MVLSSGVTIYLVVVSSILLLYENGDEVVASVGSNFLTLGLKSRIS